MEITSVSPPGYRSGDIPLGGERTSLQTGAWAAGMGHLGSVLHLMHPLAFTAEAADAVSSFPSALAARFGTLFWFLKANLFFGHFFSSTP